MVRGRRLLRAVLTALATTTGLVAMWSPATHAASSKGCDDLSPKFVGRDSPEVATRVVQGCLNQIAKRGGTFAAVDHCGGVSLWDVASGGRMGAVFGEDATEVAPPATACTKQCTAQNQVRGQAVILGFPFPVPQANRLQPRFR
ncbi:MAG: hypothetical protein QOK36_4160 [Gaiellales bacterium]|jgi:hypothetical protein|nr:hypothetical protein [Gaiellales bacterium]